MERVSNSIDFPSPWINSVSSWALLCVAGDNREYNNREDNNREDNNREVKTAKQIPRSNNREVKTEK